MLWSTINIEKQQELNSPLALRDDFTLAFIKTMVFPLQAIADETLYKMQHNGSRIYLEKMLNEYFNVATYDHQEHETTKLIYIDDVPPPDRVYIHQDIESESIFLEDDGDDNDNDIFLDAEGEINVNYSWIIYMPDTISFDEYTLRALVDSYRYVGKKYTIEIFTP